MPPRGRRPSKGTGELEVSFSSDNEGAAAGSSDTSSSEANKVGMFCFCVAAIYGAYVTQGVLQEKISTAKYGKDQQRFDHLSFLNFAQCLVCFLWSFVNCIWTLICLSLETVQLENVLKIWPREPGTEAPILEYWACSISNAIGPACGMLALKYISYPAQVLAKSSKMIPVMLVGALVYGVHYSIREYLCTLLVAGGVALFAFTSSGKPGKIASPNALLGYALCLLNLGMDGFTNATQDSLTARYPQVNAWHLMMGMNFWGSIYMFLSLFLAPGAGGYAAVGFLVHHSEAAWDILLFCLCGAVGQNFIFLTISRFGALTNTTITTTRKFVSILVSSIWNGNRLSAQQWGGVAMVFVGLSYHICCKYQEKKGSKRAPAAKEAGVSSGSPKSRGSFNKK